MILKTEARKKALTYLTADERLAITLSIVEGKSTWEAGEIMKKAHYKYLELLSRGKALLVLFADQIELVGWDNEGLIPSELSTSEDSDLGVQLLRLLIEKRYPMKNAVGILDNEVLKYKNLRDDILTSVFREARLAIYDLPLSSPDRALLERTLDFILEYDRWNNARILPLGLQEPSAYKRRQKNRNKKHLTYFLNTPFYVTRLLVEKYGIKKDRRSANSKRVYMYAPLQIEEGVFKIIRLDPEDISNQQEIALFSELFIYIFPSEELCNLYIVLISDYIEMGKKTCNEGLEFWTKYRDITEKAYNYAPVQRISPTRNYLTIASADKKFELVPPGVYQGFKRGNKK
jgi:hypothetical protein